MTSTSIRSPKALRLGAVAAIALCAAASPAYADDTTSTLGVSATVTANCAVTTSPIAFGNIDVTTSANVDGTGGISVTCTNGTAWTATADAGTGSGATLAVRKLTSGSDLLNYALYTDSGHTTAWGDGVGGTTATITDTGTGTTQSKTIYGRVPTGQTGAPAGSYSDSVTVTVTY